MTATNRTYEPLHDTFADLCRIASPTGQERGCADYVTHRLRAIGVPVEEDDAGSALHGDTGNLLARIPGASDRTVMLGAHMDTVPLAATVDPVQRNGGWENSNDAILGADNKAAVAALLELACHLADSKPTVGVELVFTVAEEAGLKGAREFDVSALRSSYGYVLDHASPWGGVITASPSVIRTNVTVQGKAAHAGVQPEHGASAIAAAAQALAQIPSGRIDSETTANFGTISGGSATNVVADHCEVAIEVRSISERRADDVMRKALRAFETSAEQAGCRVQFDVQKLYEGYRLNEDEPSVQMASRALKRLGFEPRFQASGGGADANIFRARGFPCTNITNGSEHPHEPTERISNAALETGLDLVLALLDEAAAQGAVA